MATTKISANVLANGAALTNLNAGSTIDLTKSVSVSGDLVIDTNVLVVDSATNKVGIGTSSPTATLEVNGDLAVDTNTLYVDSTDNEVGIGTATPTANLEVNGTAIIQDDTTLYGTENTMPNQTLDAGVDSVMTQDMVLRNELNYGWRQLVFANNSESPSTATLSRTDYNIAGLFSITTGALAGYIHNFSWRSEGFFYPLGSGGANWFSQKFTMFFEYDFGNSTTGVNTWWVVGLDFNLFRIPNATDKCLAFVHRQKGATADTLEVIINDGTGTAVTSGEISASYMNTLQSKQRFCVVWDGATLSLYVSNWNGGAFFSNTPPAFSLVASVTNSTLGTVRMSNWTGGFIQILDANVNTTASLYIDCPKMIRRAVHPI
jgi:hypothetical protein